MKISIRRAISITFFVLLTATFAFSQTYTPGGGFTGSPHDFSGRNAGGSQTGGCTFCHTPHRAIQQALLWNHTLSANTFSWDAGAKTAGGTEYPTINTNWAGPSKLCLSCHDGSVAIGDIGWFNKSSWTGANSVDPLKHDTDVYNIAAAANGSMRGNHPVAFPYPFGQTTSNNYNGKTTGANVFTNDFKDDPQVNGIRLFNDNGSGVVSAGAVAGKTGIECTSCHGVHNERGVVYDRMLLRGRLGGASTSGPGNSYICTKCHDRG